MNSHESELSLFFFFSIYSADRLSIIVMRNTVMFQSHESGLRTFSCSADILIDNESKYSES